MNAVIVGSNHQILLFKAAMKTEPVSDKLTKICPAQLPTSEKPLMILLMYTPNFEASFFSRAPANINTAVLALWAYTVIPGLLGRC